MAFPSRFLSGDSHSGHTPLLFDSEGDWPGLSTEELKQVRIYVTRARAGDPRACFTLAVGRLSRREFPEAARWMWKAAVCNDVDAAASLATMYLEGLGLPRDEIKSDYWLRRSGNRINEGVLNVARAREPESYADDELKHLRQYATYGFKGICDKFAANFVESIGFDECEWATYFSLNTPPGPGKWGCFFSICDVTMAGGLRSHFSWVNSRDELVYLFAYWCTNPAFLGPFEISSPHYEAVRAKFLSELSNRYPYAGLPDPGKVCMEIVNKAHVAGVEWAGTFEELCSSGGDYPKMMRRWARYRQSGRPIPIVTRRHLEPFPDGPLEGSEIETFRNTLGIWPGKSFVGY